MVAESLLVQFEWKTRDGSPLSLEPTLKDFESSI